MEVNNKRIEMNLIRIRLTRSVVINICIAPFWRLEKKYLKMLGKKRVILII